MVVEHAAVNRSVDSSSLPGAAKKAKYPFGCFAFFRASRSARKRRALRASTLTLVAARRFLRLPLLFPKNLCAANLFRDRCGYETRGAAIRYSVGSASLRSARSSMIADEKAARQKTMKNNAFFMVFCYLSGKNERF